MTDPQGATTPARLPGRLARRAAAPDDHLPVTMLELFFDLVFVYLVTQVTTLIYDSHGVAGYGRAALVLVVTWWMYDGFAWLANNVSPTTVGTRLPMLLAMACFLAMAVVLPDVFTSGAWTFAVAYLLVVTIHVGQFSRSALGRSAQAILALLPVNYGVALLLVAAAVVGQRWGWTCWLAAVLVLAVSMVLRREASFTIRAAHFAERHSLLVIIALGETIVAIGASAAHRSDRVGVLAAAGLSMVLVSGFWWVYFAVGDDERGLDSMQATPPEARASMALRAYSLVHLVHIAGLVLVAVAFRDAIPHPGRRLDWGVAATLAAGTAGFLVAQAALRHALRFAPAGWHLLAAALALGSVPLGVYVSGVAQLASVAAVSLALAVVLQRRASAGDD